MEKNVDELDKSKVLILDLENVSKLVDHDIVKNSDYDS